MLVIINYTLIEATGKYAWDKCKNGAGVHKLTLVTSSSC